MNKSDVVNHLKNRIAELKLIVQNSNGDFSTLEAKKVLLLNEHLLNCMIDNRYYFSSRLRFAE